MDEPLDVPIAAAKGLSRLRNRQQQPAFSALRSAAAI
jgi:hypothetical protein